MKTKTRRRAPKYSSYEAVPSTYLALCGEWLPRPIHDSTASAEATEMIDALAVFQNLNEEQSDYLDAVSHFVTEYEGDYTPEVSGLEALKHLVEENNLTGADISRILGGSRLLGAMILRGERRITADHARKFGAYFKVSPGTFL
jgi:HTH-type transcriptional regulator / antitoxin HigA